MPIINLKPRAKAQPMVEAKPTMEALFAAEKTPLLRFAHGIVRRREVAKEMVQEAFIRLHHHWEEVEKPHPWIHRAVRNLCLSHLRDNALETNLDEERDSQAVGMVRLLMTELEEKDRRLIQLKYVEDQSYANIAKATGLSVSNVGYRLHHLLKGVAVSLRQAGVADSQG